jgi:2',3'-cyclic-nucleotide 2'-phosphodiesterase
VKSTVNVLMLGDIVGQSGIRALFVGLQNLVRKTDADLVIVNGENAAAGFGLTPEIVTSLFAMGISVITSGNHIWQKREIYEVLNTNPRVLRPANYPAGAPGAGHVVFQKDGITWAVLNLQGRDDMSPINDPFRTASDILRKIRAENPVTLIDFHAESTEEKEALALYLDGEVAAIVGTHTHIQTADERVLPKGTAYISDLGMTGPEGSVIGVKSAIAIRRSLTQMPIKMETAEEASSIHGVLVTIDLATRKALSITRIAEQSPV